MRVVIDKPIARWLPTRRRFAISRLIAFVLFHVAPAPAAAEQNADRVVYAIDSDHGLVENYSVSLMIQVMITAYLAAILPMRPMFATLTAVPLGLVVIQIPFYFSGVPLSLFRRDNRRLNCIFYMSLLVAASAWFATRRSPVRYVAIFFLAVCATNAIAAAIMFMLRGKQRQMERECGI